MNRSSPFTLLLACLWMLSGLTAFAEKKEFQRSVSLEWDAVEDATGYEVQIVRILNSGEKKKPVIFRLKNPLWQATINYGKYELSLRSVDERGVPGDWSDPMEFFARPPAPNPMHPRVSSQVLAKEQKWEKVKFQWEPVTGATTYQIHIESDSGDFKKSETSNSASIEISVPVAKSFNWRVVAFTEEKMEGESPETPYSFRVIGPQLDSPKLDPPLSKFVKEITWNEVTNAESYQAAIYQKLPNGKWKLIESKKDIKQNFLPFDLSRPTGEYMAKVQAKTALRQPSPTASMNFMIQGGLRSPAAVEAAVLKDSLSKPTKFYGIASYFITQIDYQNVRYESDSASQFQELGGTGRLGLGYQDPFKNWGTYFVADLSGINIKGENYTFASGEVHGTWKLNFESANFFVLSGGLYMKELPEIVGNNTVGVTTVEKAQTIGPHAGFQYWMPLTQKLGMQFNGRAYYSMAGTAPNGQEIDPNLSFQVGVLGSLRLKRNLTGYAGYAYRLDQTTYQADPNAPGSRAEKGDINSIKLQGHYLNLILEQSF